MAIARALANDPRIILADEPTGNVDSRNGKLIIQLLKELAEQGRTVIVVTHDRSIAGIADVRPSVSLILRISLMALLRFFVFESFEIVNLFNLLRFSISECPRICFPNASTFFLPITVGNPT